MSTSNAQAASKAYAAFIPEKWSLKVRENLHKSNVMLKCVNRDYEGEIKDSGDIVKIRSYGNVAVFTYDGSITDDQYVTPTPTVQELLIDQSTAWAIKVPDIEKAQADIDVLSGHTEEASISLDEAVDTFLLAKHADVPAGNTIGTVTTPIALTKDNIYENMVKLSTKLKKANAIGKGRKKPFVVINPDIEALVRLSPEFIHATSLGDNVLREDSIGKIAGLDVMVSTNFEAVSGKYYIMAGTNDAISFAEQLVKTESLKVSGFFGDLVRGLMVYGAKTVQPNALAKIIATVA